MCKQLKINRAFNNFLIETFEFTDEQLEAIDYQIPMTQEIYNSILDRCMELGSIADDLLYRLLNEYPEYLSVHGQIIENEVKEKYKDIDIPESYQKEKHIGWEDLCRRIREKYRKNII